MRFIAPLEIDALLNHFSEARAVEHVRALAKDIDSRQEGSPGLREAARYTTSQLEMVKERAALNLRIEIEDIVVNGTFNMMFLEYSISLGVQKPQKYCDESFKSPNSVLSSILRSDMQIISISISCDSW